MSLQIPRIVESKARAVGSERWLEGLPELLASIESDWSLSVGPAFDDASEALVLTATLADGTPAVLKLAVPRPGDAVAHEIMALRLVGGDGCPKLLRADPGRGAMLLEKLGRPLSQMGLPLVTRHAILCATARRIWRPIRPGLLPTGAEKACRLAGSIESMWQELDRPISEEAVQQALTCAERRRRAHHEERAVLVHGDVHQWNALRSGERGGGASASYKLADPEGLLAEPECDLGVVMREDPEELLRGDVGRRCAERAHRLAGHTGLDPVAIDEWGVVERMSTGLLLTKIGQQPIARLMLEVAERASAGGAADL